MPSLSIKSVLYIIGVLATGLIIGYSTQFKLPSRLPKAADSCSFRTIAGAYLLDEQGITKVLYRNFDPDHPNRDLMTGGQWGVYNDKQQGLKEKGKFLTVSEVRTETDVFDGVGEHYLPGSPATVTLIGPELATDYRIKSIFCDDSGSPYKACPSQAELDAQNQNPSATITGFTVDCNTDIHYGWILEKITSPTPTSIPTAIPSEKPTNVPTALPSLTPTLAPTSIPSRVPTPIPSPLATLTPQASPIIDTIQKAINLVDKQNIMAIIENLADDDTSPGKDTRGSRYTGDPNNQIERNYVISQLHAWGYRVTQQPFSFTDRTGQRVTSANIIAQLDGRDTERYYLLGAHYDSTSPAKSTAPGADDNGSGTAGVLETARVLSKYANKLDTSVKLVLFSGEEQGLIGSKYYVNSLSSSQLNNILGVLNMDMIGWNVPSKKGRVGYAHTGGSGGKALTDKAGNMNSIYSIGQSMSFKEFNAPVSDHFPFYQRGIPAAFISESSILDAGNGAAQPCYHRTCDTPEKLDYDQIVNTVKIVIATMISLSGGN